MKILRTTILAGVLTVASVVQAAAQVTLNDQRAVTSDGIVEILNANGSVQVLGWEKDIVSVSGVLGEGVERVEFGGDVFRTTLQVIAADEKTAASSLKVMVPTHCQVEVGTVGAGIEISGVAGMLFLESVDGNIKVTDHPKEIHATSIQGELEFLVKNSRVKATSTGGRIILRSTDGEADLSTVSGGVLVEGTKYKRGQFKTVSGDLRFDASLEPKGVFEFTSHSGNIDLYLPRAADADFLVSTYEGQIENDFQLSRVPNRKPSKKNRTRVTFSTRDGIQGPERFVIDQSKSQGTKQLRARVTVDSFSGNVRLKKKTQ